MRRQNTRRKGRFGAARRHLPWMRAYLRHRPCGRARSRAARRTKDDEYESPLVAGVVKISSVTPVRSTQEQPFAETMPRSARACKPARRPTQHEPRSGNILEWNHVPRPATIEVVAGLACHRHSQYRSGSRPVRITNATSAILRPARGPQPTSRRDPGLPKPSRRRRHRAVPEWRRLRRLHE